MDQNAARVLFELTESPEPNAGCAGQAPRTSPFAAHRGNASLADEEVAFWHQFVVSWAREKAGPAPPRARDALDRAQALAARVHQNRHAMSFRG